MSGWVLGLIVVCLGIGMFVYFCWLFGRWFVFSEGRLVVLALGCALLLLPVFRLWCLSSEASAGMPFILLAVGYGFVFSVFALAIFVSAPQKRSQADARPVPPVQSQGCI